MPDILLINDDGYKSDGFYPLLKELSRVYKVTAVAPDSERSWIGKSLSSKEPLNVKKVKLKGIDIFTCSGTPADCAQIGLYDLVKKPPKLVVSGINIGNNIGHARILSSGTIGAAMEASIDGVRAIATSLHIPSELKDRKNGYFKGMNYQVFENAARITLKFIKIMMNGHFGEDVDVVSINSPYHADSNTAFAITKPHREPYGRLFHKTKNNYQHISPPVSFEKIEKGTDLKAIYENKISITPLSLELASKRSVSNLKNMIAAKW
jgi:5'-nucleotidase